MQTPLIVLAVLAVLIAAAYFVARSRRVKSEAERPMTPPPAPIPGPAFQGEAPPWLASANAPTQAPTWSSARAPEAAAASTPSWGHGPEAGAWDTQSVPLPQQFGGEPASSETVILPTGGDEPSTAAEWDQPGGSAQPADDQQFNTAAPEASAPAWDEPSSSSTPSAQAAESAATQASSPGWADSPAPSMPAGPEAPPVSDRQAAGWDEPPAASEQPTIASAPLTNATTGWAASESSGDTPPPAPPQGQGWGGNPDQPQGWAGAEPSWGGADEPAQTPAPAPAAEPAAAQAAASPWDTQGGSEQWQPPGQPPAPPQPAASTSQPNQELPPAPTWNEMETQTLVPPSFAAQATHGEQPPAAPTWGDIEAGEHFAPGGQPAQAQPAPDFGPNIGETMILNPMQTPAAAAPQAEITIESGPDRGHMYRLAGQGLTLGRSPDNDLILRDPATSGHHARFERRGTQFFVVDMGSTNGTLVNGEPVQERELKHGDRVTVGQNQVKFSVV